MMEAEIRAQIPGIDQVISDYSAVSTQSIHLGATAERLQRVILTMRLTNMYPKQMLVPSRRSKKQQKLLLHYS